MEVRRSKKTIGVNWGEMEMKGKMFPGERTTSSGITRDSVFTGEERPRKTQERKGRTKGACVEENAKTSSMLGGLRSEDREANSRRKKAYVR